MLEFSVKNQIIERTDDFKAVADSRNYLTAKFSFSEEWEEDVTAIFGYGNEFYNVILADGLCHIPWEVIKVPFFTVSLVCGDRITANTVRVDVLQSGYTEGKIPQEPTPDVYQQILSRAKAPYIGENGNWFEWDKEKASHIDTGVRAEGGADGYTPQKGIDYWTGDDVAEIQEGLHDYVEDCVGNTKEAVLKIIEIQERFIDENLGVNLEWASNIVDGEGTNSISGIGSAAVGDFAVATGRETMAGCKGYYYSSVDFEANKIILTKEQGVAAAEPFEIPYSVGDLITIVNIDKYDDCSEIVNIDHNIITVDKLPFESVKKVDDAYNHDYAVYVAAKPLSGDVTFGNNSHTEGENTRTVGDSAHAEGVSTDATGCGSHSEGENTKAVGRAAHTEGLGTVAASAEQHVQGKYNVVDSEDVYAHIVGNGTGDTDANRKNIHTLDWAGNAWFAGDVDCRNIYLEPCEKDLGGTPWPWGNMPLVNILLMMDNDMFGISQRLEKLEKKLQ